MYRWRSHFFTFSTFHLSYLFTFPYSYLIDVAGFIFDTK